MSVRCKAIKDPVYGYVEVPVGIVKSIINTPVFQRLRRIAQTSYEPLYPSATHNRFVHSLGVYFLGRIVTSCIRDESFGMLFKEQGNGIRERYDRYLTVFETACLLHDVGHAPFSHTGEGFFKDADGTTKNLHRRVAELLGNTAFEKLAAQKKTAAPHELMSVIVGLKEFGEIEGLFKTAAEKDFFARAVTGYVYTKESGVEDDLSENGDAVNYSFLNCLISLLNSSIVDVDRLDYLIRDASCTGFESVLVDYRRLLRGVRIENLPPNGYQVVYSKQSVSVLENVVFAHDSERKWIQGHPAIGYEMQLIKDAITEVQQKYQGVFCEASLGSDGTEIVAGLRVRYLCDDDIIFLMKNSDGEACRRFFNRGDRYAPLWKSEAEFFALFGGWASDKRQTLIEFYKTFNKSIFALTPHRISEKTLRLQEGDKNEAAEKVKGESDRISRQRQERRVEALETYLGFIRLFRDFSTANGLQFDFEILDGTPFSSNFGKDELRNILIDLPCKDVPVKLGDLTKLLSNDSVAENKFPQKIFYVFCKRSDIFSPACVRDLVGRLEKFTNDNYEKIKSVLVLNSSSLS